MREIQNPAPSGKGDVCAAVTNPRPWEAPGAFDNEEAADAPTRP